MGTPTNVFIHHAFDHEGCLLADVVRRFDEEGRFEFLAIGDDRTMQRLLRFLRHHHGLERDNRVPLLPMVVVMTDHSGERIESHRLIQGAALQEWFRTLLVGIFDQGPGTQAPLRSMIMQHLLPASLHLILGTVASGAASQTAGHGATNEGEKSMSAENPDDDRHARRAVSPAGSTGGRTRSGGGDAFRRPNGDNLRRMGGKGGRAGGGSTHVVQSSPTMDDSGSSEVWQEEAHVPERRGRAGGNVVNISDALSKANNRVSSGRVE